MVRAEVELDDTAIEQKIKEDTYYVICTNDVERKWTMAELIGVYKKQSVVERNWRCLKDKCTDVDYDHCSFDIYRNRIPDAKEDAGAEAHYTISGS